MQYGLILVTAAICYFAEPIANWLKLFDYPRGRHKNHASPTPLVGGVAILAPLVVFLAGKTILKGPAEPFDLAILLCGGSVGIIGIMDDQSQLSASGRILLLANFALIAFVIDPHLIIQTVHWASFPASTMPAWLFLMIASLAITGFVSSINMADGIDGLVPAAFLIWCIGFDVIAHGPVQQLALMLTGPILVVLAFNLRGKLFLGDCGTFGIGFVLALLATASLAEGMVAPETILVWFFLPVIDCLRVVASRLKAGRSPLRGGKDHFHHLLADVFGKRRAFHVYGGLILVTTALATLVPRSSVFLIVGLAAMCIAFVAAKRASLMTKGTPERLRPAQIRRPTTQ